MLPLILIKIVSFVAVPRAIISIVPNYSSRSNKSSSELRKLAERQTVEISHFPKNNNGKTLIWECLREKSAYSRWNGSSALPPSCSVDRKVLSQSMRCN
ncbi:hypothetical protein GWI33_021059 [Rhynchophorus ferrugineus]|uniref:Secreted protein n=1 Tax=Rhynchophorus ferrugineus TaxID=354439 RepID=A0A834HPJ8_RHYFE|nr:hypothetical protein GWI33_021059 [Rhynchophorus ferrugineus]